MTNLRLDLAALRSLAAELKRASEQSLDARTNLDARIRPEAIWEGQVPNAYYERYRAIREARLLLVDAQREMATLLESTADTFEDLDARGAVALSRERFEDSLEWDSPDPPSDSSPAPGTRTSGDLTTIAIDVYLTTDDSAAAEHVFQAVDRLARLIGYGQPTDIQTFRGSIWRTSLARLRQGLSAREVQTRLIKVERAIELAQIDERQADVNLKLSEAVSGLVSTLAEIPQACIRLGSLLVIKYTDAGGPVVVSRNLSQLEVRALEQFPEIQKAPSSALQALASAISLLEVQEGL
jgi:uncharacterized protein YukE